MTEFTRRKILSLIGSVSTISLPGYLDYNKFDGKIQSINYPGGPEGVKIHVIEGGDVTEDRIDRDQWIQFVESTLAHSNHYIPDLGNYRLFRFYYTNSNDFHLGFKSDSTMINIYRVDDEFDYVANIHDFDSDLKIELRDDDFSALVRDVTITLGLTRPIQSMTLRDSDKVLYLTQNNDGEQNKEYISKDMWLYFVKSTLYNKGYSLPDLDSFELSRFNIYEDNTVNMYFDSGKYHLTMWENTGRKGFEYDWVAYAHTPNTNNSIHFQKDEFDQLIKEVKSSI